MSEETQEYVTVWNGRPEPLYEFGELRGRGCPMCDSGQLNKLLHIGSPDRLRVFCNNCEYFAGFEMPYDPDWQGIK